MLQRKIYDSLLKWKTEQGKTALLIEGARRVGKSTIVKEFARNEYRSFILIDFSNTKEEIKYLFDNYASNLNDFFFFLTSLTGTELYQRDSLIVFDEVQLFPKARQLIKHLVADGRYDYIETGSLLSIKRNIKDILIPSEERTIKMFPLDFEEFCWACNRNDIVPIIRKHFDEKKALGPLHKMIMTFFRQYILVGGMPQAVLEFINTSDYKKVDMIKRDILNLYKSDIIKYAEGYEYKVIRIFEEISSQLNKHEKKFVLSSLTKDARFRDYEEAFTWLDEAMIVNMCFNANDPSIGLSLYEDRLTFKAFMADTGLLISHTFDEESYLGQEVAQAIISDRLSINYGQIFENIVAQIFTANNKKLYFYSRVDNENKENRMEIDFLIADKNTANRKISPVEVKSSKNYTFSSLMKFKVKFKSKIGQQYLIHTKDLINKDGILFLPIYMTICL